jgi:hypothetical protein
LNHSQWFNDKAGRAAMTHYVGLDVSMEDTSICLIDLGGATVWEGKVVSSPETIEDSVRKWAPRAERIGLETGPTSTWLWHELHAAGLPVVCIDARHAEAALSMRAAGVGRFPSRFRKIRCWLLRSASGHYRLARENVHYFLSTDLMIDSCRWRPNS